MVLVMRTTGVSESVTIPCQNIDTFSAEIDWGDGSAPSNITTYNDPDLTHTYAVAGDYEIRISGTFPNIYFNNTGDKLKLIKVLQLGKTGLTRLDGAFYGTSNVVSFKCGRCDTSQVTSMASMMRGWVSITETPDLSSLDTSQVTSMDFMMQDWNAVTSPPDLSGFNTSQVTSMAFMMQNWNAVTSPPDLSGFNTSQVTSMAYMMRGWSAVTSPPDLSGFNTSQVTSMAYMMQNWSAITSPPDLSGFDTSQVTSMTYMMQNWSAVTSPPDLSGFNTSKVTSISYMMRGWTDVGEIGDIGIAGFDISLIADAAAFARYTTLSTVAYDAILIAWAAQAPSIQSSVPADFGNSKYTAGGAAEAARSLLVNTYGWAITDGGAA